MYDKEDSRYDRTESDLQEAFQILSGKKELNKITVSEITKLAGVTRSTFYNHYVDMPALISAMENRIVDEIFWMMKSFHPEGSGEISRNFFDSLCIYIGKNGYLIRMLISPYASSFVEKALSMFHTYVHSTLEESSVTDAEQQAFSYAISYAIGGVVGILHKWALNGCSEPADVVARYLTNMFLDGMRPYLG